MDAISALTIATFIFCAIFLTQDPTQINVHSVNSTAVRLITTWTVIATLIMLIYRLYKRKPIPT